MRYHILHAHLTAFLFIQKRLLSPQTLSVSLANFIAQLIGNWVKVMVFMNPISEIQRSNTKTQLENPKSQYVHFNEATS